MQPNADDAARLVREGALGLGGTAVGGDRFELHRGLEKMRESWFSRAGRPEIGALLKKNLVHGPNFRGPKWSISCRGFGENLVHGPKITTHEIVQNKLVHGPNPWTKSTHHVRAKIHTQDHHRSTQYLQEM